MLCYLSSVATALIICPMLDLPKILSEPGDPWLLEARTEMRPIKPTDGRYGAELQASERRAGVGKETSSEVVALG